MTKGKIDKILKNQEVHWTCRFHPTDWFHETGCPHKKWSKKDLLSALIIKKKFEEAKLYGITLT